MAGLLGIAQDAGCKEVRCQHCGKYTEMGGVLRALFRAILERLGQGEKVKVLGFGIFRRELLKGREVYPPHASASSFSKDRWVMRFRSSSVAKRFLNQHREEK